VGHIILLTIDKLVAMCYFVPFTEDILKIVGVSRYFERIYKLPSGPSSISVTLPRPDANIPFATSSFSARVLT
jgi:hypothetical protein